MDEIRKTYSHAGITVVWQPALCIHSGNCCHGLPGVFDPTRQPWIDPTAADPQAIVDQVAKCPSGALSIAGAPSASANPTVTTVTAVTIEILPAGPLLVHGQVALKKSDGTIENRDGGTALCRCGASKNKPFCDGSHRAIGFTGLE